MVDVNVEREKVNVEQARVEVERVRACPTSRNSRMPRCKFELEKLRIQADKEVRIAAAQAMGNMLAKAQMQIFGDPDTMATMSQQFMKAAGYGQAADGLMQTLPAGSQILLANLGQTVVSPDVRQTQRRRQSETRRHPASRTPKTPAPKPPTKCTADDRRTDSTTWRFDDLTI